MAALNSSIEADGWSRAFSACAPMSMQNAGMNSRMGICVIYLILSIFGARCILDRVRHDEHSDSVRKH